MRALQVARSALALLALPLASVQAKQGETLAVPCQPEWLPTFGETPVVNDDVRALVAVGDPASGASVLYVGGSFVGAGATFARNIARWDGASWSELGSGIGGSLYATVHTLAAFDDGSGGGPALYAGGDFSTAGGAVAGNIARWDGSSWSSVGGGTDGPVRALAVFDDGTGGGPALYAGGEFTHAGGVAANSIARWDGTAWSALGSGMSGSSGVLALAVYNDGTGPKLFAGGYFQAAGGAPASCIASWDGGSWSALGSGTDGKAVSALTVFDDGLGGGPALYVGGHFQEVGGVKARAVASWDGASWSAVGRGIIGPVYGLGTCPEGPGGSEVLYAVGQFDEVGGLGVVEAQNIARWDGLNWSALGTGLGWVGNETARALTAFDDGSGSGPQLYAGGNFPKAGGQVAGAVARWDGSQWSGLGTGLDGPVGDVAVFDDGSGSGPKLFAAGFFETAGGGPASCIASWDGSTWSALTTEFTFGSIDCLEVFDDGSGAGPVLIAGGGFSSIGGVLAKGIAQWDGSSWSPLGDGLGSVYALTVYDDGSGPKLIAGGEFTVAGGSPAGHVASWDGATWSPLGSGFDDGYYVRALTVFDDGTGPALYAGGDFTTTGGASALGVARWNGASWSALGSGISGEVFALRGFDDGVQPPVLIAGGDFSAAGGTSANHVAQWDGAAWSSLGSGIAASGAVRALAVFPDPTAGPVLIAGGSFGTAGGIKADSVAQWDGTTWSALGDGLYSGVRALTVVENGAGEATLVAGGAASGTPGGDSYVAQWGCPTAGSAFTTVPGCGGNPAVLTPVSTALVLGQPFTLELSGTPDPAGLGVLVAGLPGFDASGCGAVLPGLGEVLLALQPAPMPLDATAAVGGHCTLGTTVPPNPGFAGVEIGLQALNLAPAAATAIELSNALTATIAP
jgi:trimeric autotransporter adhesin